MLFLLIGLVLSSSLSVIGSLTFWKVNQWYDFYIPIVLFIAGFVIFITILYIFLDIAGRVSVDLKKEYDHPYKFNRWLLNNSIAFIRRLALISCSIAGKEKVPTNKKFLLVCNHRSNFDNFLLTEKIAMNIDMPFISKESNFKIPIAKFHLRKSCYLMIDRTDFMQSLNVMKNVEEKIEHNICNYAIFPEGTRSKDNSLLPFHEGVFNIAIRAKCPIVICTIRGTENIKKRFPLLTRAKIKVVGVLNYEDYDNQNAKALSESVRNIMLDDLAMSH